MADANLNKNIFAGNLTDDPREHTNSSGKKSWYADIIVNRRWKNAEGEKQEETTVVVPVRTNDPNFAKLCTKGTNLMVEARFSTYTTGEGDNRKYNHIFEVSEWQALNRLRPKADA